MNPVPKTSHPVRSKATTTWRPSKPVAPVTKDVLVMTHDIGLVYCHVIFRSCSLRKRSSNLSHVKMIEQVQA